MAKKRIKLLSGESLLVSLKGLASSIVTGAVLFLLYALVFFIMAKGYTGVAIALSFVLLLGYLFFWGYISRKWWSWK